MARKNRRREPLVKTNSIEVRREYDRDAEMAYLILTVDGLSWSATRKPCWITM